MDGAELQSTITRLQKDLQAAQEEIKEKDREIEALTQQNKALTQHIKALSEKQPNGGTAEQVCTFICSSFNYISCCCFRLVQLTLGFRWPQRIKFSRPPWPIRSLYYNRG